VASKRIEIHKSIYQVIMSWKQLPSGVYCHISDSGKVSVLTPKEYLKLQQRKWWQVVLSKYFNYEG